MPQSRTGASTARSGASAATAVSNRTWSLPLPVQPWATAVAGNRHQMPPDQRPRERGYQRVAAFVERARLQYRQHVVGGELLARVDHLDVAGAGGERAGGDRLGVDALADVDQQGDHVGVVLVGQPAQGDRCVEAAGIGKNDGVFHGVSSCSRSIKRIRSCPVCGSRAINARVSSPAMVPMISGKDALSKAKATGWALAGPVFSTARWPDASMLRTRPSASTTCPIGSAGAASESSDSA